MTGLAPPRRSLLTLKPLGESVGVGYVCMYATPVGGRLMSGRVGVYDTHLHGGSLKESGNRLFQGCLSAGDNELSGAGACASDRTQRNRLSVSCCRFVRFQNVH
ncbi:hypothetical protein AVEN_108577-1 [Araneus ventricosus]|uniref:Uncharacterized protein n=1 Tax=Araneus ventricosus TaxID=182803 RepID=A0A4Y2DIZ6_ARAVE|nr:hypothetical protein AVEN_108577-1 [Araneus ventricosus]